MLDEGKSFDVQVDERSDIQLTDSPMAWLYTRPIQESILQRREILTSIVSYFLRNPEQRLPPLDVKQKYLNLQGPQYRINGKSREERMGSYWSDLSENQRRVILIFSGISPIFIGKNKEYDPSVPWLHDPKEKTFVGCPAKTYITNHCLRLIEDFRVDGIIGKALTDDQIPFNRIWDLFNEIERKWLMRYSVNSLDEKRIPFSPVKNWDELSPNEQLMVEDRLKRILI